jgi:hypothetical protein
MSRSKNSHPKSPAKLQGPKTHTAVVEQLREHTAKKARRAKGPREVPDAEIASAHTKELEGELGTGKHRLVENRVQHDVADQKSDKNRLYDDAKRHKHGNPHGKLNGGPTSH